MTTSASAEVIGVDSIILKQRKITVLVNIYDIGIDTNIRLKLTSKLSNKKIA